MKKKLLLLPFILLIFFSTIKAQPYIYFNSPSPDTTYGHFDKIVRYNLGTNSVEDFLSPNAYITPVWDHCELYLSIAIRNMDYKIYDCSNISTNYSLNDVGDIHIDEMLYSSQRNNLYIFSDFYKKLLVFDLTSRSITNEINLGKRGYINDLLYPPRNAFFSQDSSKIYFYNVDTNDVDQIWTYSLASNEIIGKRDLSTLGYSGTDGYDLTFGKKGKGIICSLPYYNNPIKDFYYRIYDFDADSGSPFIYYDSLSEAYFSDDGEFLIIMNTFKDDSLRYYHTGIVHIYNTQTGTLVKSVSEPQGGTIYTFDNYPNNIYYLKDIELPTREIYTLKMDSILNVLDLTSLNPSSEIVNSPPFTLTVNGHGFDSVSTVYFNGNAKTTTYISDSLLTAQVSTSDISTLGDYPVWVTDQWAASDTLSFTVTRHPPIINSVSPPLALPYYSSPAEPNVLTITVNGEFFTDSTVAYYNGNAKSTTYVSDSVVTFSLSSLDFRFTGNYPVWVTNYGSISDTLYFSVVDSLPEPVTPILECVRNNGDKTYTAFFGYNNQNDVSVAILPYRTNLFSPGATDRGQPGIFLPGRQTSVFSVNFDGRDLTWNLYGTNLTANKNSPPCQ